MDLDLRGRHRRARSRRASQQALGELERAVAQRTAELEEAKKHAQHLADHDALTALPNRRLLEDRLTQALALSYRNRKSTAVMFVDLDRFKTDQRLARPRGRRRAVEGSGRSGW